MLLIINILLIIFNRLQDTCEDMFDDKDIFGVLNFYDKITQSGFQPDETLPHLMCKEFYGCDNKTVRENNDNDQDNDNNDEL